MRLKAFEIEAIKSNIKSFLPKAQVYLFGSRVDDSKRGGDIDLLVHTKKIIEASLQRAIKEKILDQIGEQKLDIIFTDSLESSPFIELAYSKSIKL